MNINQLKLQKEYELFCVFYFECNRWPKDLMELYYYADRENMHLEISQFGLRITETHPMETFRLQLDSFTKGGIVVPYGEIEVKVLEMEEDSITCQMTTKPSEVFDSKQTARKMIGTIGFLEHRRGRSELIG